MDWFNDANWHKKHSESKKKIICKINEHQIGSMGCGSPNSDGSYTMAYICNLCDLVGAKEDFYTKPNHK